MLNPIQFKDLDTYAIVINDLSKAQRIYLPNIITMNPVDKQLTAVQWLFDEAVKDWNDTYKTIKKRRQNGVASKQNLEDIADLSIRLGTRTQCYINQLCIAEDILIHEYKRMAELLEKASLESITLDTKSDCKSLIHGMKRVRKFRNKVTAHTAYTKPFNEDNPETIVRSLLNLFPRDGRYTMGDNFFNGFSPHISQLPIISIFEWQDVIKPIFAEWKGFVKNKLEEIHSHCPFENDYYTIEVARPHLVYKTKQKYEK
jgi:hypothetical protein